MTGTQISQKIDELLRDDRNFDTRAGLRLYAELVRDAFNYIEEEKEQKESDNQARISILTRLTNVENGLNDFLTLRKKEQEKNETERQKWRWAFITPTAGLIVVEVARWLLSKP